MIAWEWTDRMYTRLDFLRVFLHPRRVCVTKNTRGWLNDVSFICLYILRDYLDAEHRNKKKKPFDFTGWENHTLEVRFLAFRSLVVKNTEDVLWCSQDAPQQENGYDCGVFTCQTLESLSRGEESFAFHQGNMPYLRRRMIWEIGHARLRDDTWFFSPCGCFLAYVQIFIDGTVSRYICHLSLSCDIPYSLLWVSFVSVRIYILAVFSGNKMDWFPGWDSNDKEREAIRVRRNGWYDRVQYMYCSGGTT